MASNQKSSKPDGRIVLKISSPNPSQPTSSTNPSQLTTTSPDLSMKFTLVLHRSSLLATELQGLYHQVFTEIPQNPHFHPLSNLCGKNPEIIEDLKLGFDVSFIKLVGKLRNSVDPSIFLGEVETCTKKLAILENMGYDVSKLGDRLKVLETRAEQDKVLKKAISELEEEESQAAAKAESQELFLKALEEEVQKARASLGLHKSVIEKINMKKRKVMEDAIRIVNEFKKSANSPW